MRLRLPKVLRSATNTLESRVLCSEARFGEQTDCYPGATYAFLINNDVLYLLMNDVNKHGDIAKVVNRPLQRISEHLKK